MWGGWWCGRDRGEELLKTLRGTPLAICDFWHLNCSKTLGGHPFAICDFWDLNCRNTLLGHPCDL